jgi:hypothetical protein
VVSPIEDYLPERKFDYVLCIETLEHIRNWYPALQRMLQICQGELILTVRSPGYGYHPYPEDYWRFTAPEMREILEDCTSLSIEGDPGIPGLFVRAVPSETTVPKEIPISRVSPTSLSVVVPAMPRTTLITAVRSFTEQARPCDEVIVLGPQKEVEQSLRDFNVVDHPCVKILDDVGMCDWEGVYDKIDRGFRAATKDYVMYIGDDDSFVPNGLDIIRRRLAAKITSSRAHIFAWIWNGVIHSPTGHLNPQQFVVPNDYRVPRWWWGTNQSDQNWIQACCGAWKAVDRHSEIAVQGVQSLGNRY